MSRMARKSAQPLLEVFKQMLKESGAGTTHNSRRIYSAWDAASGAGHYTIKRYFRDGNLYITTSSSVICSQLRMQSDALREKINSLLDQDELVINEEDRPVRVKNLIIR